MLSVDHVNRYEDRVNFKSMEVTLCKSPVKQEKVSSCKSKKGNVVVKSFGL